MGVQLPSEPITRKEQYLAKAAGQAVEIPAEPITREEAYLEVIANAGGGGGGTTNYNQLSNKPQIAGTTLQGNKTLSDLGIASASELANKVDKVAGKDLSSNDYSDSEKQKNADNATAISAIKDGATIDSFADVESALSNKQGTLTAGDYINLNNGNISVNRNLVGNNYDYEIKSTVDYKLTIIKSQGGTVISTNTYDYSYGTSTNIDNNFTIAGGYSGGNTWVYTALKDSTTHSTGYTWTKSVEATFDETEAFPSEDLSGYKLVIKSELDAAISSAYHHAGTKTCVELVAGLLVAGNEGNVYNMTDSGTTTADFIEGAGQPIKAGDNVGIAKISDGVYKFDLLSGFVDTTNFVQKSQTAGLLKNDGTVNDEIEGDVATLKSGLTTLDNEVNGDATVYPYADVITIEDAVPANLADCSVKIEPVQDLHGYDKPWVGGAGKNEIQMTLDNLKTWNTLGTWNDNVYSYNNVTVTVNADDGGNVTEIIVNTPQASAQTTFKVGTVNNIGQYWLTGCPEGGSQDTYALFINNLWVFDYGPGANANISATGDNVSILVANGATVSNKTFNPMLCLSSNPEPKVFAPYTNICPISGHTEVDVQRDGRNLFDKSQAFSGYMLNQEDGEVVSGSLSTYVTNYIRVFANKPVYVPNAGSTRRWFYDLSKKGISQFLNTYVFTPEADGYIRITGNTNVESGISVDDLQIEYGSSATDYEPFRGKIYTIALGSTIYGGTVYFDSGVMTVDRAIIDLGTLTWSDTSTNTSGKSRFIATISGMGSNGICSQYKKVTNTQTYTRNVGFSIADNGVLYIYDSNYEESDATTFTTAMDGVQLCYELATPTTIQLTPQQIQLLKGTNTIYASTGQISVTVNGVSGAIGSVQEQVNELAEDVAEIKTLDYSTTEQKTGQKWIDGKDIYFRVNNTPISIIANDSWYNSGFTGIDTVIDYIVSMTRDNENIGSTFNNGHVDYVNRNNEVLIKGTNFTLTDNYVVVKQILYYTKTT